MKQLVEQGLPAIAGIDRHGPGGAIKGGMRLNDDVSSKVHLQGRVRGRMPRLGKTTPFFDGALGATRFSAIERNSPAGGYAPPMPRTLEMGGAV
jgi:hypothetical protein